MAFCPIDEAFGNYMTNDLNPNPLENSSYLDTDSGRGEKKQKVKKKRINCNRRNTNFSMNQDDMYQLPPDMSDDDSNFNNNLQGYSSMDDIDLYSIKAESPTKIRKKCRKKKTPKNTDHLDTMSNDYEYRQFTQPVPTDNCIETFQGYNHSNNLNNNRNNRTNKIKLRKVHKKKNKKAPEINEIYEYNEMDNRPIKEIDNQDIIHTSEDSDIEETRPILKTKHKTKLENAQISEINNKINFIMNQISNNNEEEDTKEYNNLNDIILFVIFGVFVLIIIESLYRLITKIIKANDIIKMTSDNIRHSPKSNIFQNDTLDMVTNYIKSKN